MKYLISWELRRIFNKRNRITIALIAILLFLYLIISIIINNPMIKQDGSIYHGFRAIHEEMNVDASEHGVLHDVDFIHGYKTLHTVFDHPANFDANGSIKKTVYATEYRYNESLINLMTRIYSPPGSFDPHNVLKMKENELHVSDFYTKRMQNIQNLLKFSKYSSVERNFLLKKVNINQTKSIIVGNTQGAIQILRNFQIVQLAVILICIVILSPIFARDRQLHFEDVILSSKYGRSVDIWAKVIAGFLAILLLYFVFISGASLIQIGMFGKIDMTLPIQINESYWLSIFPFTFGMAMFWAILLGLCATIFTSATTLVLSLFTKKDYSCLLLSLSIFIIPKILSDMHVLTRWFRIFPIHMLDINSYISSYDSIVYTLFGHPIMITGASLLFSLLMTVFLLIFGIRIYHRSRH